MSNAILIIGKSGTGKSTSIRTLPPEETFLISVLDKPLPVRGANKKYQRVTKDNPSGNYFASDKSSHVLRAIDSVDTNRTEIKYLIIDDFGYILTQDFMSKALTRGYDKFNELAVSTWNILERIKNVRSDLICILMMHTDIKEDGIVSPKTIGKMLDDKVCVEGYFNHVLHSLVTDGEYSFLTNHNGNYMAKMPLEMFDKLIIPNDLKYVVDTMNEYYNGEVL